MADYRLYCLDSFGKIATAEWITASDDDDAVAQARALGKPMSCELWQRDRYVARIDPPADDDAA